MKCHKQMNSQGYNSRKTPNGNAKVSFCVIECYYSCSKTDDLKYQNTEYKNIQNTANTSLSSS